MELTVTLCVYRCGCLCGECQSCGWSVQSYIWCTQGCQHLPGEQSWSC